MKAVVITQPGGPDTLKLIDLEAPVLQADEVLIRVVAAGVNRYDLLQREGLLPGLQRPCYLVPGVECSGQIINVGTNVTDWKIGDQVCAFLSRGGYADMVAVPVGQILRLPHHFSLVECAGLPELAYTTWLAVSIYGKLHPSDCILIHEGCGEVGMLAILLARRKGARVYAAADTEEKLKGWKSLGVDACIIGKKEKFASQVMKETGGRGVNVILVDEAAKINQNLQIIALGGAIVVIRLRGDPVAKVYLPPLMIKNCKIKVIDRAKRLIDPALVVKDVEDHLWPAIESSATKPILDFKRYRLSEAANAHRYMEMVPDCWKAILTNLDGDDSGTSEMIQDTTRLQVDSLNLRRRPVSVFKNLLGL